MATTKPPKKTASVATVTEQDPVERDFMEALERLKAGKPRDKKLTAAAKAGRLRISVTTVAAEASHSRTLIGHKSCKYPAVRDRIVALRQDPENPTRMQDIVAARRGDVARLSRELKLSQSQNAALVVRLIKLEQELGQVKRENDRIKTRAPARTDKVIPLRG